MPEENLNQVPLAGAQQAPSAEAPSANPEQVAPADFQPAAENPPLEALETPRFNPGQTSVAGSGQAPSATPPAPSLPASQTQTASQPEPSVPPAPPISSLPQRSVVPMPAPESPPALLNPNFGFSRQLLMKAKEKIQFRKRKKLEKIVSLVSRKGKITNDDVQKFLRVSDANAGRYLSQLVKEGRLRLIGHPRDAKYEPMG